MDYFSTNEGAYAAAGMLVGGAIVVYLIIVLVLYILYIVGQWKVFTKAGEAGWKSIIPIYNMYILYKISWKTSMFWIMIALGVVIGILQAIGGVLAVIGSIASIAVFVLSIISNLKLAKAYGQGIGFTIGLILLPFIFMPVLGLGSSQYVGPQE